MSSCNWVGLLCGGGQDSIVCYLCDEDVSVEDWNCGNHRKQCASRNTAQLSSFLTHQTVRCAKCKDKLRIWPDQGPLFQCDSVLPSCVSSGKEKSSSGGKRYNCFLCDYDLCRDCVQTMESEDVIKIKENLAFAIDCDKPDPSYVVEEGIKDENENSNTEKGREVPILLEDDDIPLIDSQPSAEDIPILVEKLKTRPNILVGTQNMYFNPSVLDSPDIFHLRAPIVSCENILTPAISKDTILSK